MIIIYWTRWAEEPGVKKHVTEHRAGLSLLRRGLEELYGIRAALEDLPGLLGTGEYGKPYLPDHPDIHFNISHTDGVAVCAFSPEPVGVDVEVTAPFTEHLPKKALTREEREFLDRYGTGETLRRALFFRMWTLKESFLKWSGAGLSRSLTSFSFQYPDYPDFRTIRCSEAGMYFAQDVLPDGQFLAVCSAVPIGEPELIEVPDTRTAGPSPA